jgi:ABC-2 type transport system permease protein
MKDASAVAKAPPNSPAPIARPGPSGGISFIALWTLYALTFRQHLHGRRWIVMAILFLLPAALAILIRATSSEAPVVIIEFLLVFMFIPQALLPLIALVYAAGIIQDEQEEQTLTYLLIRPIPRWAIYLVKLLATLTTTVLLTTVFTALTYAAIYIGARTEVTDVPLRLLKACAIHVAAVVTYCCLFGLMGLYTKRALIAGILYAAVIEGLLANLPFSLRLITVIYYARIMAYRSMNFVFNDNGREVNMAASTWQIDLKNDPGLLDHPQLQTCLIVLAVASVACAVLGALFCARREFHVKTPEGS